MEPKIGEWTHFTQIDQILPSQNRRKTQNTQKKLQKKAREKEGYITCILYLRDVRPVRHREKMFYSPSYRLEELLISVLRFFIQEKGLSRGSVRRSVCVRVSDGRWDFLV